jgi:methyltransferase (TIGR00027 family)
MNVSPDEASRTAEYMALFRSIESAKPDSERLVNDPFAYRFLRPSLRFAALMARLPWLGRVVSAYVDCRRPGARSSGIARTRAIDDVTAESLEADTRQVVILGAGFDCRAYRIPGFQRMRVFEVDRPSMLARKRERLRQVLEVTPSHVTFVDIDFNRQNLFDVLTDAGIDWARRTLFIWEGVTNYLSATAVDAVIRGLARYAPHGRLVFTYVDRSVLDGSPRFPDGPALLRKMEQLGEPWTFGFHPAELSGYLHARGLRLICDMDAREYRARYMARRGPSMRGYDFYHVAIANVFGCSEVPESQEEPSLTETGI